MVGSRSLRLVAASGVVRARVVAWVARGLAEDGFDGVSPSALEFLDVLDCGVTVAADVARSIGVSRQMVAKTVKELSDLGLLEQTGGKGRRKEIQFTDRGERLMARVRERLRELDAVFVEHLGVDRFDTVLEALETTARLLAAPGDRNRDAEGADAHAVDGTP
jgi:DNA-binding MarR family transcriptional regulator